MYTLSGVIKCVLSLFLREYDIFLESIKSIVVGHMDALQMVVSSIPARDLLEVLPLWSTQSTGHLK